MGLEDVKHPNLSGIPRDYLPVTASDSADNCGGSCIGLYVQNAGNVSALTLLSGNTARVIPVGAGTFLPGRFRRVRSTGTTSTGIFALQG